MVGSAAALAPEDVITTQYREHGVFLQRGFEVKDFMSQLTANKNDPGKGRNMPVHYSGKSKVNIVSLLPQALGIWPEASRQANKSLKACCGQYLGNPNPACHGRGLCFEDADT